MNYGEPKYWNKNGLYQKEYEKLFSKLVPTVGKAKTVHGELLRAASSLYYECFNNGNINITNDKDSLFHGHLSKIKNYVNINTFQGIIECINMSRKGMNVGLYAHIYDSMMNQILEHILTERSKLKQKN